jgi:hypothetical protein
MVVPSITVPSAITALGTGIPAPAPPSPSFQPNPQADGYFSSVWRSHRSGNGNACLEALDRGAKLDPKRAALGKYMQMRAQCMMMTGDCAGGRKLLTQMMGNAKSGADLEVALDAASIPSCRKRQATDPTSKQGQAMVSELNTLYTEAQSAKQANDVARCKKVGAKINGYVAKNNIGSEPSLRHIAHAASVFVTQCLAENQDCAAARANWEKKYRKLYPDLMTPDEYDQSLEKMFLASFPHCKGKL